MKHNNHKFNINVGDLVLSSDTCLLEKKKAEQEWYRVVGISPCGTSIKCTATKDGSTMTLYDKEIAMVMVIGGKNV